MSQRYDVIAPREYTDRNGEKKTSWINVGVAFDAKNGPGFDVTLHAIPMPVDGAIRLVVRIPKEREE